MINATDIYIYTYIHEDIYIYICIDASLLIFFGVEKAVDNKSECMLRS